MFRVVTRKVTGGQNDIIFTFQWFCSKIAGGNLQPPALSDRPAYSLAILQTVGVDELLSAK